MTPTSPDSARADRAIVIGGGLVGLVTCFELTERGLDVTLVDPAPGSGATHYAGGMLAPVAEVQYRQEPLFPLMLESAALYPDLVERVARATRLPTGYSTAGTLVVGGDRADARHLSDLGDYQRHHGMTVEQVTVRQARKLEPSLSPRIAGAVHIPGDHQISPRLFSQALLDVLRSRGVRFIADTVSRLHGADPCRAVECGHGVLDATGAEVVLANGLGAAHVHGWYEGAHPLQLRPVYGDIMYLGVPELLQPLTRRVIRAFVEDRPVYLIPRDDGTLTLGATSRENDSTHPNVGAVHDLLRDAVRLVPGLEECDLLETAVGARPGTPDDLPYLGRTGSNLTVSTGYFRHGILLAALGARTVAELICGPPEEDTTVPASPGPAAPPDLAACDPWRHAAPAAGNPVSPDPEEGERR